jgi:hypothetical protein
MSSFTVIAVPVIACCAGRAVPRKTWFATAGALVGLAVMEGVLDVPQLQHVGGGGIAGGAGGVGGAGGLLGVAQDAFGFGITELRTAAAAAVVAAAMVIEAVSGGSTAASEGIATAAATAAVGVADDGVAYILASAVFFGIHIFRTDVIFSDEQNSSVSCTPPSGREEAVEDECREEEAVIEEKLGRYEEEEAVGQKHKEEEEERRQQERVAFEMALSSPSSPSLPSLPSLPSPLSANSAPVPRASVTTAAAATDWLDGAESAPPSQSDSTAAAGGAELAPAGQSDATAASAAAAAAPAEPDAVSSMLMSPQQSMSLVAVQLTVIAAISAALAATTDLNGLLHFLTGDGGSDSGGISGIPVILFTSEYLTLNPEPYTQNH